MDDFRDQLIAAPLKLILPATYTREFGISAIN